MSLQRLLVRQFDSKSLLFKYLLPQTRRQLFGLRQVNHLHVTNDRNVQHLQVFGEGLIPPADACFFGSKAWKWLLAISLVYAGYNTQDIFETVIHGEVEDLKRFVKDNPKDVNKCHIFGWAPIHVAVVNRNYEYVEVLLKSGADPDITEGFSNFQHMAQKLNIDSVDVITTRQKYFNTHLSNKATFQGFTALHYAALLNNVESLKILIDYGADPFIKSVTGHKAIDLVSDSQTYKLLLDYEQSFERIKRKRDIEYRKKYPLELQLSQNIIGQENAIKIVSSAIRRKQNGWMDEEHPLVFLFLGSSGIGKTELAKQIVNCIHKNNKNNFIRLDMSEYQQKHEVAKMIGSPPGYIGHDDGGQLTKLLSKNPNAVVLFDEIEKAHTDVLTILLQLFDEGRMTDGKGKTIECKNAIFIMTSNLASNEIAEHALELRKEQRKNKLRENDQLSDNTIKKHEDSEMLISKKFKDNIVKPILKYHFKRDEFLGRINEIVYFLPFSENELKNIVQRELEHWKELAIKKHGVKIEWDSAVVHVIIGAYDVNYGARSIKHEVERSVVAQLAKAHEKGLIKENAVVRIVADLTKGEYGTISLKILHGNKFLNVDDIV